MPTIERSTDETRNGAGFDYEAPDVLVVSESAQLRALANDVRTTIIALLRERARSTQQLSRDLSMPKGTVAHHLKVLERAGLVHVVRTRRVRAVTEKFYGRTARLFLFEVEDPAEARALGAAAIRRAAAELEVSPDTVRFGFPKSRLAARDVARLERRLKRLTEDFIAAETANGKPYALAVALYEQRHA